VRQKAWQWRLRYGTAFRLFLRLGGGGGVHTLSASVTISKQKAYYQFWSAAALLPLFRPCVRLDTGKRFLPGGDTVAALSATEE
jgi:hypothetical protein